MSRSGFTLVDFTIPTRNNTMTHEPTEAPLCEECKARDLCFFDPTCGGCQDLLLDSNTSIPQLFAVMRQWVPQTQRNMSSLAREVLRRGANVNDRDGLTDLSLLHFACKSGATGVGNVTSAVNLVNSLINKGADCELRCKWTNMNAIHYAVFFDVPEIVQTLLEHQPALLQSVCDEYNGGTALHIASANVSLRSTEILLSHGAKCSVTDNSGHTPMDLLPSNQQTGGEGEMAERVSQMAAILKSALEKEEEEEEEMRQSEKKERDDDKENAMEVESTTEEPKKPKTPLGKPPPSPVPKSHSSPLTIKKTHSPRVREPARTRGTRSPVSTVSTVSSGSSRTASPAAEEVTMATLGMKIGDHILIDAKTSSKAKNGTIRFGGSTEFATGQWAGVELDEPIGKNDGSCMGIRYFTCKAKFGLFVPMHRVSKATQSPSTERRKKSINGKKDAMSPRTFEAQGTMHVTTDLQVGDRVMVSGSRTGTLRYAGTVKFAPGIWMGVELDNPHGKNDGSRSGVRYFKCKQNHGVFVLPSKVKRMPPVATSGSSYTASSASGTDSTDYHPSTSSSSPSPHTSPTVNKRRLNVSNAKSAPRAKHPRTASTPHPAPHSSSSAAPLSLSSLPDVTLETGMNVFVSGEFGVVKFIGHTSFSEGVWLGVELRRPNGKNDGIVKGKRYFHCRPSHGLFVKPEKATHRGINCAKILPENLLEKTS